MRKVPIVVTKKNEITYVYFALSKIMDVVTIQEIKKRLIDLLQEDREFFVINMAGVEYLSSSFVSVVLEFSKKISLSKSRLAVCCLSDNIKRVFDILKLEHIVNIFKSENDAEKSFNV